uniref:Uncharacterized protein n=1 Tax=Cacopsylla melanoneura TaxID=428564 RepID=A0A8D9BAH9_9HEMI
MDCFIFHFDHSYLSLSLLSPSLDLSYLKHLLTIFLQFLSLCCSHFLAVSCIYYNAICFSLCLLLQNNADYIFEISSEKTICIRYLHHTSGSKSFLSFFNWLNVSFSLSTSKSFLASVIRIFINLMAHRCRLFGRE